MMNFRFTLLTAHKGVDLHAATAGRVMRERLHGGEHLVALFRCEFQEFTGESPEPAADEILDASRLYNPNKHHYGIFARQGDPALAWSSTDHVLPSAWPGSVRASDLDPPGECYQTLLGGNVIPQHVAVDVATSIRDRKGAGVSGVLWRLVLDVGRDKAGEIAASLAVARGRTEGLLLNPHLEHWLLAVRS